MQSRFWWLHSPAGCFILAGLAVPLRADELVVAGEPRTLDIAAGRVLDRITFPSSLAVSTTIRGIGIELTTGAEVRYPLGDAVANQVIEAPLRLRGPATFGNGNAWTHNADMLDLRGRIHGKALLTIDGPGDGGVRLGADNRESLLGEIRITAGRLLVDQPGALGSKDAVLTLHGGKLSTFGGHHEKSLRFVREAVLETGPGVALRGDLVIERGAVARLDTGGGNLGRFEGTISGPGALRFRGGGRNAEFERAPFTLAGSEPNTFRGGLIVEQGTLALAKERGALAVDCPITLGGGGNRAWLRLEESDSIADDAALAIVGAAGGGIQVNGRSESLGTLRLDSDLVLEFSAGPESVKFQASADQTWNAKAEWIIEGFVVGEDHLAVGSSAQSLAATQLGRIAFRERVGDRSVLRRARINALGELEPGDSVGPGTAAFAVDEAADRARDAVVARDGLQRLTASATALKQGAVISFFGDSITWLDGFRSRIDAALTRNDATRGLGIQLRNRGINGGGVRDLRDGSPGGSHRGGTPGPGIESNAAQPSFQAILDQDHPAAVVILIGINDINWKGTSDAEFEATLRELVEAAQQKDARVVLATPLLDGEKPDGSNPDDLRIDALSAICGRVAAETQSTFVDARAVVIAWLRNHNRKQRVDGTFAFEDSGLLTYDGIHLSDLGNDLLAEHLADGLARAFDPSSRDSAPPPELERKPEDPRREPIAPQPTPEELLHRQVAAAIDHGVIALLGYQELDGSWVEASDAFGTGGTALALYTLAKCGLAKDHPSIVRGLAYLDAQPLPVKTYSTATTLLAYSTIDPVGYRKRIEALAKNLIGWQQGGGFAYPEAGIDLSNTQYAALGLRAAAHAGVKIPRKVWDGIAKWTLDRQERSRGVYDAAGFRYNESKEATGSMTAAGISVLAICAEQGATLPNGSIAARDRGVRWLAENFTVTTNPQPSFRGRQVGENGPEHGYHLYYLYGLERVGGLLELRKLGEHEWYREGAAWLVGAQGGRGDWTGNQANTCFALLFLSRATAPVSGSVEPAGYIHGGNDTEAGIWLRARGDSPLRIWIAGFGESLRKEFEFAEEQGKGPHVARVEYHARTPDGDIVIGGRDVDPSAPVLEQKFEVPYTFARPGTIRLSARVTILRPGTGERVELTSPTLTIPIFGVPDPTLLSYAASPNSVPYEPSDVTVTASSFEHDGRAPRFASDRRQVTGWRPNANDKAAWIQFQFKKPVRASKLLITPLLDAFEDPTQPPRIQRLGVTINQEAEVEIDVIPDPLRKTTLAVPVGQRVSKVKLRILRLLPPEISNRGPGIDEIDFER